MKGFIFGFIFAIIAVLAFGYNLYIKTPEYKCKHKKEFSACLEWGQEVLKETFKDN